MMKMASRIKEMRTSHNMSQEELGEKLGVLRQTISSWESGNVANIKRSYIAQMADLFECDPVWLMGFESAQQVSLTYSAEGHEPIEVQVDKKPIIGETAKRAALYKAALGVKVENLDIAIELLNSLH